MDANSDQGKAERSWITSDQPISSVAEDRLDRRRFSADLAQAISQWSSPHSLVIGLHAPWGEGKTSVKNLVLESLVSADGGWAIVDFNPWQWTSHSQLSDAFFDEVAIALGKPSRRKGRDLAASWRRYAAKLRGGSALASALVRPLKMAMALAAILCGIGVFWPHRIYFAVACVLLIVGAVSTWFSSVLSATSELLSPAGKEAEQSLEETKERLRKELAGSSGNILVIVDDLDRLPPKELADMIQLIKANGDLPRIVYFLVGDRQILADHLALELHVDGHAFLEKIVQIPLDLPSIAHWRLQGFLFSELDRILLPQAIGRAFDVVHWQETLNGGLDAYFCNMRSVNRFLSTFEFHVGMLLGNSAFEVNFVDLLAMEAIRLFDPKVYASIRENKKLLVSSAGAAKPSKEAVEAFLASTLRSVDVSRHSSVRGLLMALFPPMRLHGSDLPADWSRKMRVCSERHFDKYFQFAVDPRDISQSDIQGFLAAETSSGFEAVLDNFESRGLLSTAMERLRDYEKEIPVERIADVITALFSVGDRISTAIPGMFSIPPHGRAEFIVNDLMERLPPGAEVDRVLLASIDNSRGLSLPANVVARLIRNANEGTQQLGLSEANLSVYRSRLVDRMAKFAQSGDLVKSKSFLFLLYMWRDWGDPEAARAFVADLCSTAEGCVTFLGEIVNTAHSSVPNKKGGSERRYIRIGDVDTFTEAETLFNIIMRGEISPAFIAEHSEVIRLFVAARDRKLAGKSDDYSNRLDDEDD